MKRKSWDGYINNSTGIMIVFVMVIGWAIGMYYIGLSGYNIECIRCCPNYPAWQALFH
jgi:hypothetical protein